MAVNIHHANFDDPGKIGAFERRPGGGGLRVWFRREEEVEYYEGESPPG